MKNNFNIFREYVKQLMDYGKKFIIIGNMNAIAYKEIFQWIKEDKIWLGVSPRGLDFILPNGSTSNVNAAWFTNIEHKKRNTPLDLYKRYSNEYPKYDNYDAIEVNKVPEIPMDYDGVMGVPITFLDKYNPEQFEILWKAEPCIELEYYKTFPFFKEYKSRQINHNGKVCQKTYHRIFIRKRNA